MQKVISSYQQLEIWQKSIILATKIHQISSSFPKTEIFSLTNQVRRAAICIPSNIAEGWGRKHAREFIQFLRIACSSLLELETQLIVAQNLGYLEHQLLDALLLRTQEVNKMINTMISGLEQKK